MQKQNAKNILAEILKFPKAKIIITTHQKPDADAMGSSLGLFLFLKQLGFSVTVISPTDFAKNLKWMPGVENVIEFEQDVEACVALTNESDFIFCLDFNALSRINEFGEIVKNSGAKKVLIDHHQNPESFAEFNFWDVKASSTCELVYQFIKESNNENLVDKDMASCLYAGIMTDTGSFKYGNCTAETHLIVAGLLSKGANNVEITEQIYDTFSKERVQFIGFAISQKMVVMEEYNTALITITREEIAQYKLQTGDTEGLVNYGLSIDGVKFAALIIDRTKMVKMSFRSKGNFSVNNFARLHFNGGGHFNASGGSSTETLENTVLKFNEVLKNHKKELNESI